MQLGPANLNSVISNFHAVIYTDLGTTAMCDGKVQ